MRIMKDFIGLKFGRMKAIGPAFTVCKGKKTIVVCQCDCGTVKTSNLHALQEGRILSCGCYNKEMASKLKKKHGMTGSATFECWNGMHKRCRSAHGKNFMIYGSRGISVCDRWSGDDGFKNFLIDMGERPSQDHSLDRIDGSKGYCLENCRWATIFQQNNNTSRNTKFFGFGQEKTIAEWAKALGVKYRSLYYRINSGYTIEEYVNRFLSKHPFGVEVTE